MKNKIILCTSLLAIIAPLFIQSQNSSTVIAEEPSIVDSLFTVPTSVTMSEGAALPSYIPSVNYNGKRYSRDAVKALKFETDGNVKNVSITYNKVIDLSKNDGSLDLFSCLITTATGLPYDPVPLADVSQITSLYETRYFHIKLTDIYDPKIYVQFDLERRQDRKDLCSFKVTTNTHKSGGYYPSMSYIATSPYGSPLLSSFTGTPASADGNYNVISSYFNYQTKEVFAYPFFSGATKEVSRDLDDPAHLLDGDNLWTGFTTGEVKMTFEFDTISDGKKASIYLFGLNGQSFIGDKVKDVTGPNIYLNDVASKELIPEGEINKPYRMFDTYAYDLVDGKIDNKHIVKQVIYKYGTPEQKYIGISGNSFVPTLPGVYTIKYTCKDSSGNEGELLVDVTIKSCLSKLGISVNNLNIKSEYHTGDYINLSRDYLVTGGSGYYNVETYLYNNKSKQKEIITSSSYQIHKAGYYSLVYEVTDYIGSKVYYKVNFRVNTKESPFIVLPSLPNVVTNTNKYKLPEFNATDYYSFNGELCEANTYYLVSNDGTSFTKYKPGDYLVPTSSKLYVKACAYNVIDSSLISESEVQVIDVIKPNSIGSYFYNSKNLAKMDYKDYEAPRFSFNEDLTFDYANEVTFGDFRLYYSVPEEYENFNKVVVTLRDTKDATNNIDISLVKKNESAINIYLNNQFVFEFNGEFSSLSGYDLMVKNNFLYINYTKICLLTNIEGMLYSPNRVFAQISCKNVKGNSAIKFWAISSQSYTGVIDEEQFDVLGPSIILSEEVPLVNTIGGKIIIPAAEVWDALQSVSRIEITLVHDNKTLYMSQDCSVNKEVVIDDIGNYFLTYKGFDSLNNVTTLKLQIKSMNYTRPNITVNGDIAPNANKGSTISLPNATAVDVNGSTLSVSILVYQPNGKQVALNGNSFVASLSGTYIIRYVAVGTDYAISTVEYKIEVR